LAIIIAMSKRNPIMIYPDDALRKKIAKEAKRIDRKLNPTILRILESYFKNGERIS